MQERLQKLIAEAGLAPRRKAEEMIVEGRVTVNGTVVTVLGSKADPETDHIKVDGKLINPLLKSRTPIYILLNKPKGYLSATSDPKKRPLATDLLPDHIRNKVHTVGRLDYNTEGMLLLTNDGGLTESVTRAGKVRKVYQVKVKGKPGEGQIALLRRGVPVDGRRTAPAGIELLETTDAKNTWFRVVLTEGRNQQIRKMFDAIGHSVVKLRRVQIGPVSIEGVDVGAWRNLTEREVRALTAPPRPDTAKKRPAATKREKEVPLRTARGTGKKPAARPKSRGPAQRKKSAAKRPATGARRTKKNRKG